MSTIQSMQN